MHLLRKHYSISPGPGSSNQPPMTLTKVQTSQKKVCLDPLENGDDIHQVSFQSYQLEKICQNPKWSLLWTSMTSKLHELHSGPNVDHIHQVSFKSDKLQTSHKLCKLAVPWGPTLPNFELVRAFIMVNMYTRIEVNGGMRWSVRVLTPKVSDGDGGEAKNIIFPDFVPGI